MNKNNQLCIGLVGAGYAAFLHGTAYQKVCRIPVYLKTVVDTDLPKAQEIKARFGFEKAESDLEALLQDDEIDVIDLCVPPYLHLEMARKALKAGKHVICEKPLSGYFGMVGDEKPIGKTVSKAKMYQHVIESLDSFKKVVEESEKNFFYAENFVFSPPVRKMAEIIEKKKSKILFMKAVIALKGSSSSVAGEWYATGGGSFARNGVHPLTAILWLKQIEAKARGENIQVISVLADMGVTTSCLSEYEHRHITANPVDVEDNAVVTLTFSDNTKAMIFASDTRLGGSRNSIDVYCNDVAMECNLTPTDILSTYLLDDENIEDLSLSEMLPTKLGWNKAFITDDVIRGHLGEIQYFVESISENGETGIDFSIAYMTTKLIYAAYLSAEENRRIVL